MEKSRSKKIEDLSSFEQKAADSLFRQLDKNNEGFISPDVLWRKLKKMGILEDDIRLKEFRIALKKSVTEKGIDKELFLKLGKQDNLVRRALYRDLIIPDFKDFCKEIEKIYYEVEKNKKGEIADYIPQLARVNPEHFALSICTVDGQRFSIGDSKDNFCVQSTCKPINYCIAMEELGEETVHKHIGREPSGRSFNELSLNHKGLPHNPMINAGAIMACSLIKRNSPIADRFEHISSVWKHLCGDRSVQFNNSVYLSERQTADRNFALAYFMRENKAFMPKTDLTETLEFYFQCCSIESCTENLSIAAATFANSGLNPLTGEAIFNENTVRHCMSLMSSCGMYDFSGEFAFRVGVPAKSGVSGSLLVVIPNVMGISIWSPRLDKMGNSVRGVEFCKKLIDKFNFHMYDSLMEQTSKIDPRKRKHETKVNKLINLMYAAGFGDLNEIQRLEAEGMSLNSSDYDGRTALHLAASENQLEIVKYLLDKKVQIDCEDRWGNTPLNDAIRGENKEIIKILEEAMVLKDKKKMK
ncbi:glutaminase A [Aureivirga sp. CE67]|uniref:glutaminase A n=1 Tax=Aureivirga sp. CE67 TaxID=1788983 RepID=UPI0018C9A4A9|nr:glutaminase A [Aureivirga sp. CE67]